jgi:hypothetical protein
MASSSSTADLPVVAPAANNPTEDDDATEHQIFISYPSNINLNEKVVWLIQTGAFDDITAPAGQGQTHQIKNMLRRWEQKSKNCEVTISQTPYSVLVKTFGRKEHFEPDPNLLASFKRIPSSAIHHAVVDVQGNLLAYRYRLPENKMDLINTLTASAAALPKVSAHTGPRGSFSVHHYACCADYSKTIFMNSEYKKELPQSEEFLRTNQKLFDWLSDDLRFIAPHMYKKFTSVEALLPDDCRPCAGAWFGVAINQGQNDVVGTRTHQDWQDLRYGFNCVLPFGDYDGGDLILWQCGVQFELRPCDVLLFFGACIAHNTTGVTQGVRNSLDLFNHKSVWDWKKRKVTGTMLG